MPGEIARAAQGITTPSQGSFLGDVAETATGFLQGIQQEKARKEKQALEEARVAILRDTLTEEARSNVAGEALQEESTAVQGRIADAQVSSAETQAGRLELEEEQLVTRTQERTATASGHRNTLLTVYDVPLTVTESMDVLSLTEMLTQKNNEANRGAEIEANLALTSADRLRVTSEMIDSSQSEVEVLRSERQALVGQQQEQLADLISQGLVQGRPEFDAATGDFERSLQVAITLDPEEVQSILDEQRVLGGFPTIADEGADLDARILEAETRLNNARSNLDAMQEAQRQPGQAVQGADGSPGPGVSGANQAPVEVAPNIQSPAAQAFSGLYGADVTIAAANLKFMMGQQPPPPGLQDTMAWLASIGKTPEDVLAEADQILLEEQAKEEERQAAEEQASKTGRAATSRRQRPPLREQISPLLSSPDRERSVLSRSARRQQRLEDAVVAGEEPPVDPEIQAIEDQVADAAGAEAVADANKVIAIDTASTRMAALSGGQDLDAAISGYEILFNLGLSRKEALDTISDESLREDVANKTQNRISPR